MRTLRLILYFALGLLLGGVGTVAHAVTQAATVVSSAPANERWRGTNGTNVYGSWDEAGAVAVAGVKAAGLSCSDQRKQPKPTAPNNLTSYVYASCYNSTGSWKANASVTFTPNCPNGGSLGGGPGAYVCTGTVYTCPDSTWTLSGTMCTKEDQCVGEDLGDAWYKQGKDETSLANQDYCDGGCVIRYAAYLDMSGGSNDFYYDDNFTWKKYGKSRIAQSCSSGTAPPEGSTQAPNEPPKNPPCAEGEGVITTSSGKVMCVPQSTSPDQPTINKTTKTDSFPDGSTKTTNTTQTCTGAGACSTTTTTTITGQGGSGGSGTPGQAGTPGTTTSTEDAEPSETSDFCAKNPSMQICKGGIAEEGTQKAMLEEVKKLSSVDANTDKTAIMNAGKYGETPGYQAAKDADDSLVNYAAGVTKNAEVESSKSTFEQALSSGFWTDIPTASCTTPIYVIAGHEIEWDRWCEIVGYIQDFGAYGLWIMLAISVFVMLTGGRQS